ncbi:MAG TPA: glycoside hydrolase family 15 protein, partial [Chloroflexota bacterium]
MTVSTKSPGREKERGQGGYLPISAYALIGDCHTAALVAADGSIDWYCPQRFDAPAVFCRILDAQRGGYTSLAPSGEYAASRAYRENSNLLETSFSTNSGKVMVTDFMPVYPRQASRRGYDVANSWRIIRMVQGLDGDVEMELRFKPMFNYARERTEIAIERGGAVAAAHNQYLTLSVPGVDLDPDGPESVRGTFKVRAGERKWVVLTDSDDPARARAHLAPSDCAEQMATTERYWQEWSKRCSFRGRYSDVVVRSALTLKMLTYEPTGAIIAAPTTSLPEEIGGVRNWDYRYSWVRDSSLILYSLLTIGYHNEAADFIGFLRETQKRDPTSVPQVMYAVDGRRTLTEHTAGELEGYMGSRPVRIGNGAYRQFQLDIFGEILTAAYVHFQTPTNHAIRTGRTGGRRPSKETWALLKNLVNQAAANWRESDYGIWEVRGGRQQFLHSKVMCWAALDRGIRLADEHGLDAPLEEWKRTRATVREAILKYGYNEKVGAFTQAFGSSALDASALIVPRVGLLPATDPRVASTIKLIEERLTADGLVYRYLNEDGLPGGEATFSLCTLWLADALALAGKVDRAREFFENVLRRANDVGLLAEEINPSTGEQLGNFPQGFTHLAVVRTAVDLARAHKLGAEHKPQTEAHRAGQAKVAARQGYSGGDKGDKEERKTR